MILLVHLVFKIQPICFFEVFNHMDSSPPNVSFRGSICLIKHMVSNEYQSRQSIILSGSDTRAGSRINSSNVVTDVVSATTSLTPKLEWGKGY